MSKKEDLLYSSFNVHKTIANVENAQNRRKFKRWAKALIKRCWYFLTFRGYKNV